jgi:hypothetical protein
VYLDVHFFPHIWTLSCYDFIEEVFPTFIQYLSSLFNTTDLQALFLSCVPEILVVVLFAFLFYLLLYECSNSSISLSIPDIIFSAWSVLVMLSTEFLFGILISSFTKFPFFVCLFQNLFLFADFFHSSIELVAFLHLFI